jgi:uncharacterized membrane protein
MVCLVGHKCDEVVFSDYSKFFGINLEVMGYIYYAFISLFYVIYLFFPNLISDLIFFVTLGLTTGGLLFSIFLTYIQFFKLKSFCSWCLSSAAASIIIFFSSYSLVLKSKPEIISFVESVQNYIKLFEFTTLIIGIGIFTVLEIIIFKFLRDFRITKEESKIIKAVNQVGWFVLFLYVLNNIGVYLPEIYSGSSKIASMQGGIFWIETIVVGLIVLNSFISQLNIIPTIIKSGVNLNIVPVQKICLYRKIAILQSALSIILWYGLFYINFML